MTKKRRKYAPDKPPIWWGGRLEQLAADHKIWVYLGFYLLALLTRVAYILSIADSPLFDNPTMDGLYHHEVAQGVAGGDVLGDQPYYRSPVYMYLLGGVYALFGEGFILPRLLMAALGAASVVLAMRVAERLFGFAPALITGIIATFCWMLIYFDGELLVTSLAVFITLLIVNHCITSLDNPTLKNVVLLGLLFGIGALIRQNYMPIIFVMFALMLFVWRKKLLLPFVFIGCALLVISPVTIRNYVVLDDFVPITYYTGVNFYIGNNEYADGRTAILPYARADWWGGVEDTRRIVEEEYGRAVKPSEISGYWTQKAVEFIANNFFTCERPNGDDCPGFLELSWRRFLFVFDLLEYSNNKQIYFFKNQSAVLGQPFFLLFSGFLYLPLGILGMFIAIYRRQWRAAPLLVVLGGYVIGLSLSFVASRLRMPIIILLIIFSGYGLCWLLESRALLRQRLLIYGMVWVALLAGSYPVTRNWQNDTRAGNFILGNAFMRKNQPQIAEQHYLQALGLKEPYASRTNAGLAQIYTDRSVQAIQSEDFKTAKELLLQSLSYAETPQALLNLAQLSTTMGDEDPLPHYLRAVALAPYFAPSHIGLGRYYLSIGDLAKAQQYAEQAEKFNVPPNPQWLFYIERLKSDIRTLGGGEEKLPAPE